MLKKFFRILLPFFLFNIFLLTPAVKAVDLLPYKKNNDKKMQLETIQQEIEKKEKMVGIKRQKRDQLLDQLKKQAKEIEKAKITLSLSKNALNNISDDITQLSASIPVLQNQEEAQQSALARQLDFAFRQGKLNDFQFLLKSEETHRSGRILAYMDYLNKAREKSIKALKKTRSDLNDKKNTLTKKKDQQNILLNQQKAEQIKLKNALLAREKTLALLEASLKKDQLDLADLKLNEKQLMNAILKAQREAKIRHEYEKKKARQVRNHIKNKKQQAEKKGKPYTPSDSERFLMSRTSGIGTPKGKAIWPVKGTLLHRFGEPLQGELRWKGMVIATKEDEPVKAIADGYVLLAAWLQGYGLVVVIEHRRGDMSLYGYNKKILAQLNTEVKAGQTIALAGNTPFEGNPALYFEIRQQGQAVNPLPWLKK